MREREWGVGEMCRGRKGWKTWHAVVGERYGDLVGRLPFATVHPTPAVRAQLGI